MKIQWSKQSFNSLKKLREQCEGRDRLSDEELALKNRYEDIQRMVESNRVWPPVQSAARRKFDAALRAVLSRLPEKDFIPIEAGVGFVFEDPYAAMLAVNVPAPPSPSGKGRLGIDTIIFFHDSLNLSLDALTGLVTHELAHTLVHGDDHSTDEAKANAKARRWGFGRELDCLKREKEMIRRAD